MNKSWFNKNLWKSAKAKVPWIIGITTIPGTSFFGRIQSKVNVPNVTTITAIPYGSQSEKISQGKVP